MPGALGEFSTAIKRFADAKGATGLYHETITWAFLLLIAERQARNPAANLGGVRGGEYRLAGMETVDSGALLFEGAAGVRPRKADVPDARPDMTLPALVIFDMAGTTIEDRGQVPTAFAETLAANGITITADEIARVRGASKRQAIRNLLPPSRDAAARSVRCRADRIYEEFRREPVERLRQGRRPLRARRRRRDPRSAREGHQGRADHGLRSRHRRRCCSRRWAGRATRSMRSSAATTCRTAGPRRT